jgi:hypothetical protein
MCEVISIGVVGRNPTVVTGGGNEGVSVAAGTVTVDTGMTVVPVGRVTVTAGNVVVAGGSVTVLAGEETVTVVVVLAQPEIRIADIARKPTRTDKDLVFNHFLLSFA